MLEQSREIASRINENFTIFQREDSFKFGTDAVLLSRFAGIKKKDVLFDICSGTGAVGFFCHLHLKRYALQNSYTIFILE